MLAMLRCFPNKDYMAAAVFQPVSCNRVKDLIRIGDQEVVWQESTKDRPLGMSIEPYGLSDLDFKGTALSAINLQLDLPLNAKLLDAFAFAGLPSLRGLRAWRQSLALESCSLAGLPKLETVVLNCSSTFNNFLTFGDSFKSLRLVGCRDLPIQFVCTRCKQQPNTNVLRVLPGPPSAESQIIFETLPPAGGGRLPVGQCIPGVCSDEHLCRNNYALKLSKEFTLRQMSAELQPPVPDLPANTTGYQTIFGLLDSTNSSLGQLAILIILPLVLLILLISALVCACLLLRMTGFLGGTTRVTRTTQLPVGAQPPNAVYSQIPAKL
ncbi:hypothetical protein AAHC03_09468 [Spirometra sp. Aus1]